MRQTLVRPLGVITQPNEQGQYPPGAMSVGHNIAMRDRGVATALPASVVYGGTIFADPLIARRIWPTGDDAGGGDPLLYIWHDNAGASHALVRVSSFGVATQSFPELTALSDVMSYSVGKVQAVRHRERYYVTSDQGVFEAAGKTAGQMFLAGWPPPRDVRLEALEATAASVMADDTTAAYKAVFVRRNAAGKITKLSPPSYSLRVRNESGGTRDAEITVSWPDSTTLIAGDIVELYRTPTQDVDVDPGSSYNLAVSFILTSTEITAQAATLHDATSDAALGAELYTNEIFGGEAKAKFPPGLASDVAMFGGYAFYIMEEESSSLIVRVREWGILSSAAQRTHGIGSRQISANWSSGVSQITSISDVTGIVAGQEISDLVGPDFPAGTTLLSVNPGAGTANTSAPPTGSATGGALFAFDRIEVNGDTVSIPWAATSFSSSFGLVGNLPDDNPVHFEADGHIEALSDDNSLGLAIRFFMPHHYYGDVEVRATNGQNYDPALPEIGATAKVGSKDPRANRLRISEVDQPWAVPPDEDSELIIGNGTIYRIIPTTDALYVFASDGLYRVTGPAWVVDQIDPTLVLASRNAVCVLKDTVWAYTSRGLVRISGVRVEEISEGLIGDQIPGAEYADTWDITMAGDEANAEVHLFLDSANKAWVFSVRTTAFTTTDYDPESAGVIHTIAYDSLLRKVLWVRNISTAARSVRHFRDDIDSEDAVVAGVSVVFQPITGDGEPFTLKEWIDCTYDLEILTTTPSMEIQPEFSSEDQSSTPIVLPTPSAVPARLRSTTGISREVSLAPTIAPGLAVVHSTTSLTIARWKLYGLSLRWMPAAEESTR